MEIMATSKNYGKKGSDHFRDILNPYREKSNYGKIGRRRRLSKLNVLFFSIILSVTIFAIIGIITKASVSPLESSCFSKYPGAPQGHHVIFHAKGPLPAPSLIYIIVIYHCYISYIIYHCCILVGTNNAATR